jgi:hypothetical protein
MTKAATPKADGPAELPGSGTQATGPVSAFHRDDLHRSAITDAVIDSTGIRSDPEGRGWVLPWRDGTEMLDVAVFDRDKRPASGMKVVWPKGRTTFPNVLRQVDSDRTVVVEGIRQSLAAASHAPADCSVVGMNGCDGIHKGISDRLSWAKGQRVWLVVDADHQPNDRVRGAVGRVTELLRKAGATSVRLVDLPGSGTDGLDDVLAASAPERRAVLLAELLDGASEVGSTGPASRLDDAFFELGDLVNLPAPEPLLTGLLDVGTVAVLAGKFATYKTFVALGWAASVATGRSWGSHTVPTPRPVLYVAAEGATGIRKRLAAWQERHGTIPRGSFYVLTRPARMTSDADADWLRDKVRETEAGLVVLDTWHQSTPGAEENSNTDMGAAFSRVASIRSDTGATVLILHHTGHAGERSRGASSLEDDADTAFVIKLGGDPEDRSPNNPRVVEQRKTKDGEALQPFRLTTHPAADSMVVEPDPFASAPVRGRRGRPADSGREAAVTTLVDALDAAGVDVNTGYREVHRWAGDHGFERGVTRVTEGIVREAVKRRRDRSSETGQSNAEDPAAVGAVARYPSRGGGTAPQSPDQCGGNAVESPPQLSPAQTPPAVGAVVSEPAISTAPSEGTAVETISTAAARPPRPTPTCPKCHRPGIKNGRTGYCSTHGQWSLDSPVGGAA